MKGLGVVLVLLATAVASASALGQDDLRLPERLPSGPTYPLLFDDFAYPVPVGYDRAVRRGPTGSLFGPNAWLAGLPGEALRPDTSRFWYAGHWYEGVGNTGRWWGDGPYTIATTSDPGHVVLRAEGTLRRQDGSSPEIRSGFSARTGTWLARVRLPRFDGLRFHTHDGEGLPVSMIPAFWAQSNFAIETREAYYFGGKGASWFEWNFEINNWIAPEWPFGRPACTDRRRRNCVPARMGGAIGTGLSWSHGGLYGRPTRWAGYSENPVPGETSPGTCFVLDEERASVREPAYCFAVLTGAAFADQPGLPPTYAYLQAVVTPEATRFALLVRDEDADGRPADLRDGFELLIMETPPYENFVTPLPMQTLFTLGLGWSDRDVTDPTLPEPKELGVDWMLYTPQTDRALLLQAADGRALQDWLDQQPGLPRRIHSVPWERPGPPTLAPLDARHVAFADTCTGLTRAVYPRNAPYEPFDFEVEVRHRDGVPYFLAVFRDDETTSLRLDKADVRWEPVAVEADGRTTALPPVQSNGYGLVASDPRWREARSVDLTVTMTLMLGKTVAPGQWENRVLDPACYGTGAAAMHTRTHRYRYVSATGALERRGPDG